MMYICCVWTTCMCRDQYGVNATDTSADNVFVFVCLDEYKRSELRKATQKCKKNLASNAAVSAARNRLVIHMYSAAPQVRARSLYIALMYFTLRPFSAQTRPPVLT